VGGARLEGLTIRSGELIAVIAGVLSLSILLWNYERVEGWKGAAAVYALVAVGPLLLRAIQTRFPESRLFRALADFSPIAYIVALYLNLNPILDAVNIPIADAWLVRLDQQLFGVQLSIWMDQNFPPLLNDVLLGAYTTYFFWPAALGLLLWVRGREDRFDEWVTALMFFYSVNYAMYAIVPAMGPRYFQAAHFDGPVQGLFLASQIDLMFQGSPLARDCFPSGHTGISLLVLAFSWQHARRFFWVALPVLVCLILGTLAGRFHYGIDLLAAVPLTATSLGVAALLRRRVPEGFTVSRSLVAASFRRLLAATRD
jgi:hypothetical protein